MTKDQRKEIMLGARTEEEKECGRLLGCAIYCMVCKPEPDQHVVLLRWRHPKEVRGDCETCGHVHMVTSAGEVVCFEKGGIRQPLYVLPGHPEDKYFEEMLEEERQRVGPVLKPYLVH